MNLLSTVRLSDSWLYIAFPANVADLVAIIGVQYDRQHKMVRVRLRVTAEQKALFKQAAQLQGKSVNKFVLDALSAAMSENKITRDAIGSPNTSLTYKTKLG